MDTFEWDEQTPVTANNMNEMQNILNNNVINNYQKNAVVLWTNPNPNADFSSQTITLSSDDYDVLEFYYRSDTGGMRIATSRCLKGYTVQFDLFSTAVQTRRWGRRANWSSNTKYNIDNCNQLEQGQSISTANGQCVPLYVVGYKTGLFN